MQPCSLKTIYEASQRLVKTANIDSELIDPDIVVHLHNTLFIMQNFETLLLSH